MANLKSSKNHQGDCSPGAAASTTGLKALPLRAQAALAWIASFLLCGLPWIATAAAAPQRFAEFPPEGLNAELWGSARHWAIMAGTAVAFEPITWLIHRYIMHGGLWWVHEDHHDDTAYSRPELYKNDFFPLVFAVPSSGVACWVCAGLLPHAAASIVLGALAYGVAYLYVHEELFHRRFGLPLTAAVRRRPYVKRLATAHGLHHSKKVGAGVAFGFLYAPPRFDAERVQGLVQSNRQETLWDYYAPLFGFDRPCDVDAAAPQKAD